MSTRSRVLPHLEIGRWHPRPQSRQLAIHICTVLHILIPEPFPQRCLFVENHEKVHAQNHHARNRNRHPVCVPEDNPQPDPSDNKSQVHGIAHLPVKATTPNFCGGAIGAGVPRPVRPKSQTHRRATANPSTDGTAASHRQFGVVSTRNPNHPGSSQNHSAKNAVLTASEAKVVHAVENCGEG